MKLTLMKSNIRMSSPDCKCEVELGTEEFVPQQCNKLLVVDVNYDSVIFLKVDEMICYLLDSFIWLCCLVYVSIDSDFVK